VRLQELTNVPFETGCSLLIAQWTPEQLDSLREKS
jgi:hypothetical protein